ncbi:MULTISPECIES: sodium-dependent bicarbonate transport family permease [unclassified Polynucleobacter]|uniref:sodium-dependent bicarbonate transport family permease n=1 Tax=unclassified Polynucleobacter TaxID=2640945 RepID=UPI0008BDABD5|nr:MULTISPECIES: sodium-dependent bicarbonate transport family permease [unclassified Polynucleobacter]OHC09912.1 MAG: sodium-dependent bicarbonate transport family permease [Polynucleobacter sp. GWA2_45_21]HBK42887.1 sodium-dependent bicarbonate transport family permease [Polynucleobacter sp.]
MANFLDPAILFFIFGAFAGAVKSNLEIPQPIARFLSLYLLMALGLKGGFALHKSGFTAEIALSLGLAVFLAILIPIIGYQILRTKLNAFDAAAIAATYGSVSAVTFITATQYLDQFNISYGGHMAAAMALMESPAVIFAIVLANKARSAQASQHQSSQQQPGLSKILHESFTDGAQLLLLGSMVVGLVSGDAGQKLMAPFSIDLFKGMLAFFLLDMGLMAARNIKGLRGKPPITLLYAIGSPLSHALIALGLCKLIGLPLGNTILLMVLASSASYIAVPAVLRHALPEVNPGLYMGMSLGITFPFNIILGIPLYAMIAKLAM